MWIMLFVVNSLKHAVIFKIGVSECIENNYIPTYNGVINVGPFGDGRGNPELRCYNDTYHGLTKYLVMRHKPINHI